MVMRDFERERSILISELDKVIEKSRFQAALDRIKSLLVSTHHHTHLNGELTSLVIDELHNDLPVGKKIIEFEKYFRDTTNLIRSDSLRRIAKGLQEEGLAISYYGRTWTKQQADWIYFETVLDLEKLRIDYQLEAHIVIHENHDTKSGTEKGFIDTRTGEGLMGKLP
jgi:hypothetical protein